MTFSVLSSIYSCETYNTLGAPLWPLFANMTDKYLKQEPFLYDSML